MRMLAWVLVLGVGAPPRAPAAGALLPGAPPPETPGESTEARITLDVKDVEIVDAVRLLAEVGGFQVVFDPGISCKLTLKLKEVRWPAALEVALRSCGLARDEQEGIVRVATLTRLNQESAERRKLEDEKRLAGPLRATRYRLSYARAEQLAPVLKKFLSPRGEVVFDPRTNTLIIVDVP